MPNTHEQMNRRSFLKLSGLLGIGVASAGLVPTAAEAVRFNRKLHKVSMTRLDMGTFVSMTLVHPSKDEAEEAMGRAFDEIRRLTRTLNRFDSATAVALLNQEGVLKAAPPEVCRVVSASLRYHRLSQGAFDITVQPIVDLYKQTFSESKAAAPASSRLKEALSLVGSEKVEVRDRAIHFHRPGMGVTLDGIAKGYIVDRASSLLERCGIENYLINAGGDIRTKGSPREKKSWTVAVQDPEKQKRYPDIIDMTDGAIATSGNYEVYFDREKMFHHIVDPNTGYSPELSTSVSVRTATAMDADAMSTCVFVMGPRQGTRFIDGLKSCESLVIDRSGKKISSRGWHSAA